MTTTRVMLLLLVAAICLPRMAYAQWAGPGANVNRRAAERWGCELDSVRARAAFYREHMRQHHDSIVAPVVGDTMCEVLAKVGEPAGMTRPRPGEEFLFGLQYMFCRGWARGCIRTVFVAAPEPGRFSIVALDW